ETRITFCHEALDADPEGTRMTHQAPSRWQPPRRNPQHGAAAGHAPPSPRDHVRRALRLIVTAGSCAAGLCLVVGLVALVAAVTKPQPSRPTNIAATASGARGTTKLPYQPPPALVDAAHPDHGGRGPSLLHPAPGARCPGCCARGPGRQRERRDAAALNQRHRLAAQLALPLRRRARR